MQLCLQLTVRLSVFLYKQLHTARSKLNRINWLDFYLWKLVKQRGASSLLCNRLSGSVQLIQLHLSTVKTSLLILWNSAGIFKHLWDIAGHYNTYSRKKTNAPFTQLDSNPILCQTGEKLFFRCTSVPVSAGNNGSAVSYHSVKDYSAVSTL